MSRCTLRPLLLACAALLCIALLAPAALAAPLRWQSTSTPDNPNLSAVAYGNGTFVAVGAGGAIRTSPDGIAWMDRTSGTTEWLHAVAYGGGKFVAVGEWGTILTSPDGSAWTARTAPARSHLSGVAYGNGQFLAVGDQGTVLASPDGIAWTLRRSRGASFGQVAFGKGLFVSHAGRDILTSADGVQWEAHFPGGYSEVYGLAYGGGQFVAVGHTVNTGPWYAATITSSDGLTWTPRKWVSLYRPRAITYGAGRWVALGHTVLVSTDATRWAPGPQPPHPNRSWLAGAYGGGRYAAVGDWGMIAGSVNLAGKAACGDLFPDVPSTHAACVAIEQLAARNIINGYPDGRFRPERTVTRAEFVKLVAAALKWPPEPEGALPFSDVSGHWAATAGYLQAGYSRKMINGYPDGTFRPDNPVTRAEIVKMGAAAVGVDPSGALVYRDVGPVHWYAGWTAGAARDGLIHQQSAGLLFPGPDFEGDRLATRAEAALLISDMLTAKRQ